MADIASMTVSGITSTVPKEGSGVLAKIGFFILDNIGGIFKRIRDKAKGKKALEIALAGGYDSLTPYQKSLIGYQSASILSADPQTISDTTRPIITSADPLFLGNSTGTDQGTNILLYVCLGLAALLLIPMLFGRKRR